MDVRTLSVTLAVALLLAPSAFAAWSVKGAWEPDTVHDVFSPWSTLQPNTGDDIVVYFNGFSAAGGPLATTANPNLVAIGSSYHAAPFLPVAMLGIWKDCNADGYVGMGDNGLLEYRADLLLDDDICPPTDVVPGEAWRSHNAAGWVIEFMPIGYDDVRTGEDENPYNLNDTTARVWADWGLPGDAPRPSCSTVPAPYGTFRSTGGLLRYADCFASYRGTQAVTQAAAAAGRPTLGFGDAPPDRPDQSQSELNVPNPWGDASDASLVTVYDCSRRTDVEVGDPTDPGDGSGELHTLAVIPVPMVGDVYLNATDREGRILNATVAEIEPTTPTGGSPGGTVNETEALVDCDRDDADQIVNDDGEPGGSDGDLPYTLEGAVEPVSPYVPRTRTDHVLTFEEGLRGSSAPSLVFGSASRDDAGLGAWAVTGFWVGAGADTYGVNPVLSRSSLGAEPVTLITYYAWIHPALRLSVPLVMPNGPGFGSYAEDGCSRSPPTAECDRERWWRDGSGADVTPRDARLGSSGGSSTTPDGSDASRIGVRIGQPFSFQDIDCIDSSTTAAREGGLHWGRLSGTRCERP